MSPRTYGTPRPLHAVEGRAGPRPTPPPKIYATALYLLSLSKLSSGSRVLLGAIIEAALRGRVFSPDHRTLAKLAHKSPRTIKRWTAELRRRRFITVTRPHRRAANVYRLERAFWARLVAGNKARMPRELQGSLFRLGLRMGQSEATMAAAGVRRPR